ncbi:hypothetical protein DERF_001517 [Dermatophagoides farinae]|uniref:Uncharacterized protein n=1 Tax=Dermatophagoides farinae TaxID=6954 RepID=A0A922I9M5_DERFA|nr:hypothetical protein DERF_001517 [Dermatophagoides farinae]
MKIFKKKRRKSSKHDYDHDDDDDENSPELNRIQMFQVSIFRIKNLPTKWMFITTITTIIIMIEAKYSPSSSTADKEMKIEAKK